MTGASIIKVSLNGTTIRTEAVKLQEVTLDLEIETVAQHLANFLGGAIVEFEDLLAGSADQVVVVAVLHQHVVGGARALVDGANEAEFLQQIEGSVDGHPADARRCLADKVYEFVGADVTTALDQGLQNSPARAG